MKTHYTVLISLLMFISCTHSVLDDDTYVTNTIEAIPSILDDLLSEHSYIDSSYRVLIHPFYEFTPPVIDMRSLDNEFKLINVGITEDDIRDQNVIAKRVSGKFLLNDKFVSIEDFNILTSDASKNVENVNDRIASEYEFLISISAPTFTIDLDYFFVYEYIVYGRLKGSGSLRVYKKNENNWELMKIIDEWIS